MHRRHLRRGQAPVLGLGHQFLLARHQAVTQRDHVGARLARLGEEAVLRALFLLHMMRYFLAQHRHLGFEERIVRAIGQHIVDQHLGAVMFDIGFVIEVVVDLAFERRVEDLFLDHRMDFQLVADFLRQLPLAILSAGLAEPGEQVLHLAVIGFQQGDGVGKLFLGHGLLPL